MIPIWGTYKEAEDLYNNPSWSQAGWTALSALGDASLLLPVAGPEIKAGLTAAKAANTIGKAAKLSKAERFVPLLQDANKVRKVAHTKMLEDVTWPAMYSTFVRPSGVVLSMPFRLQTISTSNKTVNENDNTTNKKTKYLK